jgi:PilZ domain-containing protein
MAPNDKRASPRFLAKSGNHVIYIEGSGAIADLSLNGVFVLDPDPLPVGTHIHLELRLGANGILVKGIVRRSVAEKGMGIQFPELSREGKSRLKIHLANSIARSGQAENS